MDKIILLFKMLLRQEWGRFVADRETEDRIWRTVLRTRIRKRKKGERSNDLFKVRK